MNILLTGAAGLIGGELARRLVARGHRVTALVHRTREVRGNDGALVAVAEALTGDVTQPRLGWDPTAHARVAAAHQLVIHCAASVRFDLSAEEGERTNVAGTRHVAELARAGGAAMLHVSTAYVCGRVDGPVAEGPVPPGTRFANGYEASKAAAEAVVEEGGLPWTIARPSIVVGEHATGAIRQFDTIYAAFRLIAEGRVRQLPASQGATLDFVPIDHVAGGLADLAERRPLGAHVHLTASSSVPVPAFADAIARWPHFARPRLVAPERFDVARLPPTERRLYARVAAVYATYFQRDPRFEAGRLAAASGRVCPPTDAAFLHRLMTFAIDAGFLPEPPSA